MLINPYRYAAGPGAGFARYWRIVGVGLDGGDSVTRSLTSIAEIEMASTPGGANIAGSATWTASSTNGSGGALGDIKDGITATLGNYHAHNTASSEWWKGDFGSAVTVREIRLYPRVSFPQQTPTVVSVQASADNSTWFTLALWQASTPWGTSVQTITVGSTALPTGKANARLWGLDITESNNASNVGFAELEFATSSGGTDLCTGGLGWHQRALDSTTYIGQELFDNDNSSLWNAPWLGVYDTCRVGYLFATAPNPTHCRVRARASFMTDSPKTFKIVWSDDGLTWNTTDTVTGATGWTASEQRTYTIS
jgi:hypothetical protein